VESGVETSYLGQFGIENKRPSDRGEIMWLVQRGKRSQRLQFGEQLWCHSLGPGVSHSAVHDPVAKRI
jgi:hypothetical protein